MSAADAVFWLILAGIAAYVVLAGADFGAGVWNLTAERGEHGERVRHALRASVGPLWEANHVWLVFVLVMAWTAFPGAFADAMRALFVPLSVALLGIVLRGGAFALAHHADGRAARRLDAVVGASSVLTPFAFGTAVGALASGRVPADGPGDAWSGWTAPFPVAVGVLAVALCAYLAAVYMDADARRRDGADVIEAFHRRALGAGAATGVLAAAALVVARADAPALWHGLTGDAWWAAAASAACGVAALALVAAGRPGAARPAAASAVAFVVAGWAAALHPRVMPGGHTVAQDAASGPVLATLLWTAAAGAVILIPSLALLFRLALTDRVSTDYAEHEGDAR